MMSENWSSCLIEDVADRVHYGYTASSEISDGGAKYLRITDIQDGHVDWSTVPSCSISDKDLEKFRLSPNDLVFARTGGTVGKSYLICQDVPNQAVFASYLIRIILNSNIEAKFIYLFFQSLNYWEQIELGKTGLKTNVNAQILSKVSLNLAPLPEQRAIVSKIEQLFSAMDNGTANLKKAQAQLKVYRQAVLKKAFNGDLTREWRETQKSLPTAVELLQYIKQEREAHYQNQLTEWKQEIKDWEKNGEKGKKPSRPSSNKYYSDLSSTELDDLPELPVNWFWEKLGNACVKIMDGTHFSPKNSDSGEFKYISAKHIKEGRLDVSQISYVSAEDHREIYERCDVKFGDVLYIKDGATTGRAVVNPLMEEFSLLSSVGVFRTSKNSILPKYLEHFLNSQVTRNRMLSHVAGVAITRLTLVKLNNSEISICSIAEQHQIVQEIESRLSVCDKLEESIRESLQKSEALRQSILKRAFAGQLLTEEELAACRQEKDWEPAGVLLERVRKEKEKNGKKK